VLPPVDDPLFEREAELAALAPLVCDGGTGRLVVLEGPAGIGKSRLAAEALARAAAAGFETLSAFVRARTLGGHEHA
jgi:predicted ATPase